MNIAWNDPESHGLPGGSEALDSAGCEPCDTGAGADEPPAAAGPVDELDTDHPWNGYILRFRVAAA